MEGFFLKSNLFNIEPGEDEQTNPHCYGKQLANWLKNKFNKLGYEAEVIPEDWGWCVMCTRKPYMLWVGCGNIDAEEESNEAPCSAEIIWHCFVVAEVPFMKKLFGKVDTNTGVVKLTTELHDILESEPEIKLVEVS